MSGMNKLTTSLLLVTFLAATTQGQVSGTRRFSAVPKPLRARLVERLNLYVALESAQRFEQTFEMLSEAYRTNQGLSREWYLATRQPGSGGSRDKLLEFKPTVVEKAIGVKEPDVYDIVGWAKYNRDGKIVRVERVVEARMQNGDWYFSEWLERVTD